MAHTHRGRGRGGAFRTDTDISRHRAQQAGERELQPWTPDPAAAPGPGDALGGLGDDETFGSTATASGKPQRGWDQFATNAALFGATTTYSEDLYTTRLDRSSRGFKAREREAERLAREIEGQVTTNVHVAEERGQVVQGGEAWDEEDRYSGVVRRAGAYVPPGARHGVKVGPKDWGTEGGKEGEGKADAPDGELATNDSAKSMGTAANDTSAATDALKVSPAKPNPSPATAANITSTLRQFAETERSKIAQAKLDIHKTERERRLADLVNFGKTFKVPGAKPKDLEGVLVPAQQERGKRDDNVKGSAPPAAVTAAAAAAPGKPLTNGQQQPHRPPLASGMPSAKPRISMHIPEIPPFKGSRPPPAQAPHQPLPPKIVVPPTADTPVPGIAAPDPAPGGPAAAPAPAKRVDPVPPSGGLNPAAAAFAFKPNPAASTFKPGNVPVVPASNVVNGSGQALPPVPAKITTHPVLPGLAPPMNGPPPAPAAAGPGGPALQPPARHPFFVVPPRRVPGVNIRDEFNPMRSRRAGRPEETPLVWQYSGRRVLQALHHPMHPSGMYNLHVNGVHPNHPGGGGGMPPVVPPGPGMIPPMQPHGPPPHGPKLPVPGMSPILPPPGAQQQQQQKQPNGLSPARTGTTLEDERFSPVPQQPGSVVGPAVVSGLPAFQPGGAGPPGGGGPGPSGPGMGPAGGFNAYRGVPHQPMQHMGQPGMFAQYPGAGGVFMGNPMMQGMPYNPQMMGSGPMRPVYYPQPGMTSHPTSPMPHAMTPQMMSPHPPP